MLSILAAPGSSEARRARKLAKARLKDTNRLLRRAKNLKPELRASILETCRLLEEALRGEEVDAIKKQTEVLGEAADHHLASYRKPAWRETLESVGTAVLIALVFRSFVLEAFKIPSGSMIPTLAIGDQIFVNKLIYGIRIPFTSIRLVNFFMPERGDVIVFICPCPSHADFIKRVVGLPGDRVEVRESIVYVNGRALPRSSGDKTTYWDYDEGSDRWYQAEGLRFTESNGEKSYSVILEDSPIHTTHDYGPFVVPEGEVFVMGDNRDNSWDSRAFGAVPLSNILGRSMFVWWSWGPRGLAFERLGSWID